MNGLQKGMLGKREPNSKTYETAKRSFLALEKLNKGIKNHELSKKYENLRFIWDSDNENGNCVLLVNHKDSVGIDFDVIKEFENSNQALKFLK